MDEIVTINGKQPARFYAERIIRLLEPLCYAQQPHTLFEDWLSFTYFLLKETERKTACELVGQEFTPDPEDVANLTRLDTTYGWNGRNSSDTLQVFFRAAAILMEAASTGYEDVLGAVYMDFAYANSRAGQFFTPMHICRMMAEMTVLDGRADALERIYRVARRMEPLDQMMLYARLGRALGQTDPQAQYIAMMTLLAPLMESGAIDPIAVYDPAVGSGAMLLATAACYPSWAIHSGLIQFFGQDIDFTCVRMAQVNLMLYGLNGAWVDCILMMNDADFAARVPDNWKPVYEPVREAHKNGDTAVVEQLTEAIKQAPRYSFDGPAAGKQLGLFGEPAPVYKAEVAYA
jgi:hypothetical protein